MTNNKCVLSGRVKGMSDLGLICWGFSTFGSAVETFSENFYNRRSSRSFHGAFKSSVVCMKLFMEAFTSAAKLLLRLSNVLSSFFVWTVFLLPPIKISKTISRIRNFHILNAAKHARHEAQRHRDPYRPIDVALSCRWATTSTPALHAHKHMIQIRDAMKISCTFFGVEKLSGGGHWHSE